MQVSHLPVDNGEGMQVLHYTNGQKYEPHHDYFHDKYVLKIFKVPPILSSLLTLIGKIFRGKQLMHY